MPPPRLPRFSTLLHLLPRTLHTRPSVFNLPHSPLRKYTPSTSRNATPPKEITLGTYMLRFGQFFLAAHFFWKYFYSITPVHGVSMIPTIPHDYSPNWAPWILISKYYRRGRDVKVGDVIIYAHPMKSNSQGCKRVIGMPGDYVSVMTPGKRDADITLSKEEEARRQERGDWASVGEEMIQVPEGHCWLAGDNLEWSRDSRLFGPVPLALVKGKVLALCWPWSAAKWFGGPKDGGRLVDGTEGTEEDREWIISN